MKGSTPNMTWDRRNGASEDATDPSLARARESDARAEGRDGYRVAFSLVEVDMSIASSEVFVVFERDGKPLPSDLGPIRLVVPTDKRGARWVRQLASLTVVE